MHELASGEFRIEPLPNEALPKSRIYIDGKPTDATVAGAYLEASLRWNDSFLIFTTDDVPFEEMLRIIFLDENLSVIDSAMLGAPYSTGSFRSLKIRDDDTVEFRFIGGITWVLKVFERTQLRVPLISDPRGVTRKFSFGCRFKIFGKPLPEI
ncbi:hypothetical protein FAZ95_21470 [Trinickia violacea]|uniref:Uncharacterized protein n=1 Tax=Trinickia violacea TaxID=2571746 RepID=A0A4V1EHU6_9BURK|nr:hypothetical protein [Trinickia violacea]QCP51500.1 hypothetical protein FAZ95_21470 [Trinickia violacea]